MKLKQLLRDVSVLEFTADMEQDINNVVCDSRKVTDGSLFLAVSGFSFDGNQFIPMAMAKGAAAVVTAKRPAEKVPYVLVESDRKAMALIGCNFYGHPARDMTIIGVTGTNGKTSTTLMLKQVLEKTTGAKVGLIGTMENMVGDRVIPTERTTPESLELQGLLSQMRSAGCRYVVMEVSSHAIALERIGGIHFDVAAFTNLTQDHLDFHKTMENYCMTKAKLFRRCNRAVINRDDAYFEVIRNAAPEQVLTTSVGGEAQLTAANVALRADGISFTANYMGRRIPVQVQIPGRFTVCNALTVLGIALQLGVPIEDAAKALTDVHGARGRAEVIPTPGKPYTVLLDYAHTPDGLENILRSVRNFCAGQLIVIFGCGGDRDPGKRPIMGEIAVRLADLAVITSDNPRTEKPMAIICDIVSGISTKHKNYVIIEDRRQAIRYAMDIAGKNDIIVLAGKGHETYQEINGVKYHLDEREEVAAYLKETR